MRSAKEVIDDAGKVADLTTFLWWGDAEYMSSRIGSDETHLIGCKGLDVYVPAGVTYTARPLDEREMEVEQLNKSATAYEFDGAVQSRSDTGEIVTYPNGFIVYAEAAPEAISNHLVPLWVARSALGDRVQEAEGAELPPEILAKSLAGRADADMAKRMLAEVDDANRLEVNAETGLAQCRCTVYEGDVWLVAPDQRSIPSLARLSKVVVFHDDEPVVRPATDAEVESLRTLTEGLLTPATMIEHRKCVITRDFGDGEIRVFGGHFTLMTPTTLHETPMLGWLPAVSADHVGLTAIDRKTMREAVDCKVQPLTPRIGA